ncbi:MAG TPA: LuxR C-terminal-related transcriptional regulator [Pyrinomonadaceae bacterium]|nr:LuxR C-terminal-related transcriptional regulator [Pyrinomonadaceae bacterium]
MISEPQDRFINEQIAHLIQFQLNHQELRKQMLDSLLKLIKADAPCTIFRLNRSFFITNQEPKVEKIFDFTHQNFPRNSRLTKEIKDDLEAHIISVSSLIEAEVYRQFDYPYTGVSNLRGLYDLVDLLNRKCLRQIAKSLVRKVQINDIMLGWIRPNLNEVWVIGLRRYEYEPKFIETDYELLDTFVKRFYDFRFAWYGKESGSEFLQQLTTREQETIYHFICGLRDKETATQMKISKRTLDAHWQNIFNKLGVNDKISVLDKLGMITKVLTAQT